MAKRSQRRSPRHEKDQAGCISGLISIFDFRHGRTTRKLITDRKRGSKPAVGSSGSSSKQTLPNPGDNSRNIEDDEENEVVISDLKTSVKELMEEEMGNEKSLKNQRSGNEIDAEECSSQNAQDTRKNRKQTCKSVPRPSNMHLNGLDDAGYLKSEASTAQAPDDLEVVMEELCQIHQKSSKFMMVHQGLRNDDNKLSDRTRLVVEEKVNAAVEVFISQRLRNTKLSGEDDKTHHSKELMDALQTLSSNKDFILKLLQDPNSRLVKQIGSLEDAQLEEKQKPILIPESNMLEEKHVRAKTDDVINQKQHKFFRRRSKSQECYPSMEGERSQRSSKIVILKPGPTGLRSPSPQVNVNARVHSQQAGEGTLQNERHSSHFSFTEIKRRLKHAMGKDRHGTSMEGTIRSFPSEHLKRSNSDRGIAGENVGWSSPNRNHFYTEKFAKSPLGFKKGDNIVKSKDVEAVTPTEASDFPRLGMSNIYVEARKHLLEMLDDGDEATEVSSGQLPKSLGRILSFAEYSNSPVCSPRKTSEDSMVPSQVRGPPTDPTQGADDNIHQHVLEDPGPCPSPSRQDLEIESSCTDKYPNECTMSAGANLEVPFKIYHGNALEEIVSSAGTASPEGGLTEETTKTSSSLIDLDIPIGDDVAEAEDNASSSQGFDLSFDCLKVDPPKEDQLLPSPPASPACFSIPSKIEDPESVVDRMERPSPISVLEPLYAEDDISPASTVRRPVELEIQPRKIHFEEPVSSISEQHMCPTACFENEESAFEYVEAVLLGSGLNWDEFLLRWFSSAQVLDPSLFDEVELFTSRSCNDQKLLFDCTNEVLEVVCERYFGCITGISFGKNNIRPVPKGMDLINEIWGGVESHLQYPVPHSLDNLVKKDLERSVTWMDLRSDLGHIGIEIGEVIMEELMEDTILSFANDTRDCEVESSTDM